jgi:FSR family fosmidomycin resistance protein-like MFS transporter
MTNTQTHSKPQRFQTENVLLISFSHLLNDTYAVFVAPLLPLLINKLGLSYFLAGALPAAIRIPSLLNPFIGIIADKVRLRYFIIISPAITGVMMSLLGLAPSYLMLLLLTLVAGISTTCYHVTAPVMMKFLAGDKVGRGMSFFALGGDIACTVGPLVILGAVSLWGLERTYWLIPFSSIASLLMYIRFKKISIQQHFRSQTQPTSLKQTSKALFPLFLCLTGMFIAIAAVESALTSFLPTYLTVKGVNLWAAGASLSLLQMGGIAGSMMAGTLSDRFGRKNVLFIIVVTIPILMWLFVLSSGISIIPLLIGLGMSLFGIRPVLLAIVNDTNSDYPAYVNSIYMMINFVTNSLMILGLGVLSDKIGLENTYRVAAALSLGTVPCTLVLPGKLYVPMFIANIFPKFAKQLSHSEPRD